MKIAKAIIAIIVFSVPMTAGNLWSEEIHNAARAGDLLRLKALVANDGSLIHLRDADGKTPLHHAVEAGRNEAAEFFLDRGASIEAADSQSNTPLHRAAYAGNARMVRLLLGRGADLEAREMRGRTPLFLASNWGHDLETVRLLTAAGANVNDVTPNGQRILVSTLYYGRPEIIDHLLDRGARLPDDGQTLGTVIYVSASNGLERVFGMAVEAAEKAGLSWWTVADMHAAARGGAVAIGRRLAEKGAGCDGENVYGVTPLHIAAENGRRDFARFLLERGARIDAPTRMGRTAFHLAKDNGFADLAEWLRSEGASTAPPLFPEFRGPYLGQPEPGDTPVRFLLGVVSGHSFDSEHSPAVFSLDGSEVYWTARFGGGIQFMKHESGRWTEPRPAPFSSEFGDGEAIFSPDGSYLIFASTGHSSAQGRFRFFISYRMADGGWTSPVSLGEKIHTVQDGLCPSITPDGRFMFFIGQGDIWWVSADFINRLRPEKNGTTGVGRSENIHDAVRKGDLAKVRALVEADAGLINLKDGEGRTPLHWASLGNRNEIISLLVEKGAGIDILDSLANAPLHYLAGRGNEQGIRLLLGKGADPDILDNGKNTPLHLAAQANAVKAAKALIEEGAKLELRNDYGRTPLLMCARERGGPEMTKLLIGAGANVNAGDRAFSTSLELAAWRGKKEVVDLLLGAGANVPTEGRKAIMHLMFAASQGLDKLFDRLEAGGAELTIQLPSGGTLLHEAAGGDSIRIVEKLLAKGLDVGQKDELGWTPLHCAALNGRETIAAFLIEKGADKDARNAAGQTAFNVAAEMKQHKVQEALVKAGASVAAVEFPELRGEWLGQKPPGETPEVFALGIVSSIWGLHTSVAFSPDGTMALWTPMVRFPGQIYSTGIIYQSTKRGGRWTAPEPAPFSGRYDDDVPFFSPDGKRLYFISARPLPVEGNPRKEAIWYVERQGEGWSEAKALPWAVNKNEMHWQFSVDRAGSVYFGSGMAGGLGQGDLYRAKFSEGRYLEPENLGPPVSSADEEATPYISPDGNTLIFMKDFDLVVSFRKDDGGWTEPASLGPTVNSTSMDLCPLLSPDGKYLFFLSQRGSDNQAWWVEAKIIDKLRKDTQGR